MTEWEKYLEKGNTQERLRAGQIIELTEQLPLTTMIPELGQLVIERIVVKERKNFIIRIVDGVEIEVRI